MRNKGIKIMVLLMLIFSMAVPVQSTSAASKSIKVKVTLVSAVLTENNHVGNEWYTTASINGKEISEDSSVVLDLKSTESVKLKAYAEEQDKIPESATATASIKASAITKDISKAVEVTVVENRGRYSGNTATWTFTFEVQKQ
ncbi:hypothetical protein [Paenibacillus jilunlii]|uniref:Uncharacterized protein n=1 Tax=Paenibacillus jilunlii TaxID=682956 RepID=A0A1G9XW04_9BACL|nr:hypothetical protein [Paenibacillus jilunlii]KWX79243.1 hypothetical protein AML91_03070 [Paenibacillus jilunlii]SDN00616.1 hypothetical protein SAMN05216191_12342 [Paenibacillus jilunlii]